MKNILIHSIMFILKNYFKYISIVFKKILTRLLLKTIDALLKLKTPMLWLGGVLYLLSKSFGKFFILPIILPIYRLVLRGKSYWRRLDIKQIPYLIFIKKYLPRLTIFLIVITITSHNILAQTYGGDDYTNNNLLSALITPTEAGWSELIEETGPATSEPIAMNKFLEEQGAVQETIITTPFPEEVFIEGSTDTSPDASSLVQINAQDNEIAQRTDNVVYTVKNGDVLGAIAEQFGISVNTILWANDLTWSSTIKAGQQLTILPQSGIEHEVKSGDTVLAIAKKYQVAADDIISNNKLASASDIRSGDLLFIPNGVKPTAVKSSYTPKTVAKNTPAKNENVYSDEKVPGASEDTNTKLLWPVLSQRITQYFHWGHSGLDIGDKTGNPIYAAESGKVERSGWSTGYGYNVVINHGNGLTTLYGHASKLLVKAGDTVTRGETIALVGSTGWSTGPHLHMEVRVNDVKKNPLNYIK